MALFGRPTPEDDAKAAAWRDWLGRRDSYAIGSFVLGVFSLTHLGTLWIDGLAAVVLGIVSLKRLAASGGNDDDDDDNNKPRGHVLAIAGILSAALSLVLAAVFVYRWV